MSESSPIRVYIADDDPMVRTALISYLAQADDITVVGTAEDGATAVAEVQRCQADVVLMDLRMPKMDGLEAARRIVARQKHTRILMLTAFDSSDTFTLALRTRVHGFLLKTAQPASVIDAVRTVYRGMTVFSPEPISRLGGDSARPEGVRPRFTEREQQVLALLCQACSNAEIAQRLHLSESRVKAYVSSIMAQLGVESRLKAVVRALDWKLVKST